MTLGGWGCCPCIINAAHWLQLVGFSSLPSERSLTGYDYPTDCSGAAQFLQVTFHKQAALFVFQTWMRRRGLFSPAFTFFGLRPLIHTDLSSQHERCSYIWWKSRCVLLEVRLTWGCKPNLYEARLFLSLREAHLKVCIIYEIAASSRISTDGAYCTLHTQEYVGYSRLALLVKDATISIHFSVH